MAGPLAEFVVSLDTDGNIVSQGSVSDAIAKDATLQEEMKREEEAVELDEIEDAADDSADKSVDEKKGKLVVAEEIAHGHVSWKACECHILRSSRTYTEFMILTLYISQALPGRFGR